MCVLQAVQLSDEPPDSSTVLINLAGTVLFAALNVADQRAAGARVERRTQASRALWCSVNNIHAVGAWTLWRRGLAS